MKWPEDFINKVMPGDCLETMKNIPDESVQCCITSPPYWGLRDYGHDLQIGLEQSPDDYVAKMVSVFNEVSRILKADGTLWLILGDSYASQAGGQVEQSVRGNNSNKINAGQLGHGGTGKSRKPPDGLKPKDMVGIPWMVAFALRLQGWYLRSEIIWYKKNPMPESVTDRPTKAHENIFLLSKSQKYYYDHEAIKEQAVTTESRPPGVVRDREYGYESKQKAMGRHPKKDKQRGHGRRHAGFNDRWDQMTKEEQQDLGRNKRSVWEVATKPFTGAHFAVFPEELIEPCILAGSKPGDIIFDPFGGSGTVGKRSKELGRKFSLIELNPEYCKLANQRICQQELELHK